MTGQNQVSTSTLLCLGVFAARHEFWNAVRVASACEWNPRGLIDRSGHSRTALDAGSPGTLGSRTECV